jgi:hypothetical protein
MTRQTYPSELGVLGIMKNEAYNVVEWIDHYIWAGVDQIFLIDNGSTDDTVELCRTHPQADRVHVLSLPRPHAQFKHYQTAIRKFGIRKRCRWLMIADLDEFWFVKDGRKIPSLFPEYEGMDVIYANWTIFGSSGFETHPGSLRKELLMRHPGIGSHLNTKWICRTSALRFPVTAATHKIRSASSTRTISDNLNLQINHYMTQSEDFFRNVKMVRGAVGKKERDYLKTRAYFDAINSGATQKETLLRDLLERSECA